eukprot:SAG11_NODE_2942_length_2820_cov_16.744212_3_plen_86_part_00
MCSMDPSCYFVVKTIHLLRDSRNLQTEARHDPAASVENALMVRQHCRIMHKIVGKVAGAAPILARHQRILPACLLALLGGNLHFF